MQVSTLKVLERRTGILPSVFYFTTHAALKVTSVITEKREAGCSSKQHFTLKKSLIFKGHRIEAVKLGVDSKQSHP